MSDLPPLKCNGCTTCCRGDTIVIRPDHGDDHRRWKTDFNKATGVRTLRHGPDGNCIYLGPKGCRIHGKQPIMCRIYDCRLHYLHTKRTVTAEELEKRVVALASLARGRELLEGCQASQV